MTEILDNSDEVIENDRLALADQLVGDFQQKANAIKTAAIVAQRVAGDELEAAIRQGLVGARMWLHGEVTAFRGFSEAAGTVQGEEVLITGFQAETAAGELIVTYFARMGEKLYSDWWEFRRAAGPLARSRHTA
ncbi:hypothetical protein HY346_02865 [Candidatus Microgenomates bacterium]|nr:hypothetical protein [Candidatus Microgenomates bacterium]